MSEIPESHISAAFRLSRVNVGSTTLVVYCHLVAAVIEVLLLIARTIKEKE